MNDRFELQIDTIRIKRKCQRKLRRIKKTVQNLSTKVLWYFREKCMPSSIAVAIVFGVTTLLPIGTIVNANSGLVSGLIGDQLGGFTLTKSDPPKDALANANNQKAVSQMQGADILTLQTFQTSPFKAGTVRNEQTFEALERDLSIQRNYSLFQKAALEVLNATGLCRGGGLVGAASSIASGSFSGTSGLTESLKSTTQQYVDQYKSNAQGTVQQYINDKTQGYQQQYQDYQQQYQDYQQQYQDLRNKIPTSNSQNQGSKLEIFKKNIIASTRSLYGVSTAHAGVIEDKLKDCANNKPDEFAAVSNMIRSYFEWQNTELRTVMQYYQNKIISPVLRDRIEGRLVNECLRQNLVDNDTASAMNICRSPMNWPVQKTFYSTCANGSKNNTSSSFQYKQYVSDCILSNIVKDSVGSGLVYELLPNFSIKVSPAGVVTETSPITATPATAYHMIYEQVYSQISSEWFASLITQGCLPSVFAPKEFGDMVLAKDPKAANYYSICLPQKLIQRVNALPKIDAEFFFSVIAKRIAAIQVAELLNGAVLITEETHRNLMAADREIGTLVETYPRYMDQVAKMYLDQLNLVNSKKLDDVLERIETIFEKYEKEITNLNSGNTKYTAEIIRQRKRAEWNE